jgi:uncharacterized protein YciI
MPKQYLYLLKLTPRLLDDRNWSADDGEVVEEHLKRLQEAAKQGRVILAGRTQEPSKTTFGLVIFEAEDDATARSFMESDPAVAAGVMTATLHPYAVAALRK